MSGSVLIGTGLSAQNPDSTLAVIQPDSIKSPRLVGLVTIGSHAEDGMRTQQITGDTFADAYLIRSPSRLTAPPTGTTRWRLQLIAPEIRTVWNSAIPLSLNDGAMWAGRGTNVQVMTGIRARYGRLSLILAPELVYSANRDFETLPLSLQQRRAGRSAFAFPFQADSLSRYLRTLRQGHFAFPFQPDSGSIDMPIRFGDQAYALVSPGQSSLTLDVAGIALGLATENQWWGPGIWNGIVMSNNAAGFPHAFIRTTSPVRTRIGTLDAKWMLGGMTESLFFDTASDNDLRSISGLAATFQPAGEPNLTVGFARVVYAPVNSTGDLLEHALDPIFHWERRSAVADTMWSPEAEQIFSLFGRWVFPASGFEAYAEWARFEVPVSLRDVLSDPNHSQGYTFGGQWARAAASGLVRLQGEATYLEKSATFKHRPIGSFYTSRSIPQGYTHRGQVVGASIGPGSSSQHFAADYFAQRWRLGFLLERIRWYSDALYVSRSPDVFRLGQRSAHARDVSVIGGLRIGFDLGAFRVDANIATEKRYNFLFQNPDQTFGGEGAVDIRNQHLELRLTHPASLR